MAEPRLKGLCSPHLFMDGYKYTEEDAVGSYVKRVTYWFKGLVKGSV